MYIIEQTQEINDRSIETCFISFSLDILNKKRVQRSKHVQRFCNNSILESICFEEIAEWSEIVVIESINSQNLSGILSKGI